MYERRLVEAAMSPAEANASACRFAERLAATAFGIRAAELNASERGSARTAFARHAAMYLARIHLELSFSEIGRAFGRDRTTVAHACARIEDRRDDPRVDRILDCLEATLDLWQQRMLRAGGE